MKKWKQTFAEEKFWGNMKLALLSVAASYLTTLVDSVLIGQVMGEDALQAFALVTPFISLILFAACIISSGTAMVIAMEVGKGSRERGNQLLGQGVIISIVVGMVISLLFLCISPFLFQIMDVSETLQPMIHQYFLILCFLPVIQMLNELLYGVIWNAGGDIYCIISLVIQFFSNIILSIFLMKLIGISGTGAGTILSFVLGTIVLIFYFRSENNVFQWEKHFSLQDIRHILKYSARDSTLFLFLAIAQFIMNTFLMKRFGGGAVMICSVIMNIESLYLAVFDAPAQAVIVLLNVFVGEKNRRSIMKSMRAARIASGIEGLTVFLLLMLFAARIPALFGIHSQVYPARIIFAVRIYAVLALLFPFIMLYSTYYLSIRQIRFSVTAMTMQLLVMPLICGMGLSFVLGEQGVWIGMVAGSFLMFFVDAFLLWKRHENRIFPYFLDKSYVDLQLSYDIPITEEAVMGLVNQVEQDLMERQIDTKKVRKIMLMIEETEMLVVEKNEGKPGIIQCDIFLEDPIRLILRDSGAYSDATDDDNEIESFRAYTAARIIGNENDNFVIALGNNRTLFEF